MMIIPFIFSLLCIAYGCYAAFSKGEFLNRAAHLLVLVMVLAIYNIAYRAVEGYSDVISGLTQIVGFPLAIAVWAWRDANVMPVRRRIIVVVAKTLLIPATVLVVLLMNEYYSKSGQAIWKYFVRSKIENEARLVMLGKITYLDRDSDFRKIDSLGIDFVERTYTTPEALVVHLKNGDITGFLLYDESLYNLKLYCDNGRIENNRQ